MTGLIAASWQNGSENRAKTVFNDAKAAFRDIREVALGPSAQSANLCVSGSANSSAYKTPSACVAATPRMRPFPT